MVVLQFKPGTSTFQLLAWGTLPAPTRHSHVTTGLHSGNTENTVQVIKTMYQTGLDMQARYKETSLAGLVLMCAPLRGLAALD